MILDIAAMHVSPCIKICLSHDKEGRNVILGEHKDSIVFSIEKESEKEFHIQFNSGESSTEKSFTKALAFARKTIEEMMIKAFEMEVFNQ